MDRLEGELKKALARKQPAPGFADAVIRAARRPKRMFAIPRWIPAAAALVVVAGGSFAWREHQGRVAKERVMLAMKITAGKLNRLQAHVKEVRP
jgi:hypothetical protein